MQHEWVNTLSSNLGIVEVRRWQTCLNGHNNMIFDLASEDPFEGAVQEVCECCYSMTYDISILQHCL